jgi:hypothetical protein
VRSPGWRVVRFDPNLATGGIAALGANNAWLAGDGCANSSCDRASVLVRHWDGKAWARAAFPYRGDAISPVAADGHGGIWLAIANAPGSFSFCHYSGGRWTKSAAPSWDGQQVMPQALTWIPGTRSLWAAGGLDTIPGDALLKYGP